MKTFVDALDMQCRELEGLVSEFNARDWERETRCPPMTVRELVAHVARSLHRLANALAEEGQGPPTYDRVSWWRYGDEAEGIARSVVDGGREEAGKRSGDELAAWLREGIEASMKAAADSSPHRVAVWRGALTRTIRADELVASRVLEVGVHTMDLGHATLKGERIHAGAVPVVTEILDGLLGSRLPPSIGWHARTYILTGTGRRPLSSIERHTLGPLAERFPLVQ